MKKYRVLFALALIPALLLSCATGLKQVGRVQDATIIIKNIDPAGSGSIRILAARPGVEDPQNIDLLPGEIKYYSASSLEQHSLSARYRYTFVYKNVEGREKKRQVTGRYSPPVYFDPDMPHTFTIRHNTNSYGSDSFESDDVMYEAPRYDVIIEEVIDVSVTQVSLRDSVIQSTFETISSLLPSSAKIAVINVSSNDSAEAEYIIEEMSLLFVNSRKYTIVDRRTLDAIRQERNFQMSGEVDDDSVVSIGHFLGADIVLTGSISGEGEMRRLRFRALDVKTAQVLAMSSEKL
ncbi:MAG: CsgG/HfaB family protein [Treponema sp.]|jgi:hypothetical protein|nr:CsgG/HfaB family protein [Treponema sp.]